MKNNKEQDITLQVHLDNTRHKRFTSSKTHEMASFARNKVDPGAPFATRVEEVFLARIADRTLEVNPYSRSMAWGEWCERFAFEQLGMEWKLESRIQYTHEKFPEWWSGRPDVIKVTKGVRTVADIKCPEIKNFALWSEFFLNDWEHDVKVEYMKGHKDLKKYYWQLVSNAILTDSEFCQLIIYLPTPLQLQEIQDAANDIDEETLLPNRRIWDYKFIADSSPNRLPFLPSTSKLKPLCSLVFKPPQSDREFLFDRISTGISEVKARLEKFESYGLE